MGDQRKFEKKTTRLLHVQNGSFEPVISFKDFFLVFVQELQTIYDFDFKLIFPHLLFSLI